jgi:16S rRNA (cytidine1402-2'-O)-methyltransferase
MQNISNNKAGKLFIVATPIGNLKDITFRAVETLQSVDMIACEDTRTSAVLLNKYNIRKRLISFHKYSKKERVEELIEYLKHGANIAMVTDAGTPNIADPGAFLIRLALENNIKVIPVPGPSALTSAVSISGTCENGFIFLGFMPSGKKQMHNTIEKYFKVGLPVVFYESPKRLLNTLDFLKNYLVDCKVFVFKELTKLYEDYISGDIKTVFDTLKQGIVKGEYTIIVEPPAFRNVVKETHYDKKSFLEIASKITGLTKREIYKKLFTK